MTVCIAKHQFDELLIKGGNNCTFYHLFHKSDDWAKRTPIGEGMKRAVL
jgi:hypothetical protein